MDTENKPITATKPAKKLKKRGRKGNKIITAFQTVPNIPVNAEQFANENGISVSVLRQRKRFDNTGLPGTVQVRKDKKTGELMIWRETEPVADKMKRQFWLAELDSHGNPKLIDGAHPNKESVERILAIYRHLGRCNNGVKYAIAQVLLSEPTGELKAPLDKYLIKTMTNIQRIIDENTENAQE